MQTKFDKNEIVNPNTGERFRVLDQTLRFGRALLTVSLKTGEFVVIGTARTEAAGARICFELLRKIK